ncbi:uncharacterized protein LOC111528191, partial [Piliocolobus tephrosceles]|uniref:uncharacterized protein LOC111528191 n=1 Tax=Piliocolobus tephrosceles TaxID=591936 RepID=UPI000E6AED3E
MLNCLDGKKLDVFTKMDAFVNAKNNLILTLRNSNSLLYNFIYVNKLIFLSITNYQTTLKYCQLNPNSEEVVIQKYEEEKIGEIISRLQFSTENIKKAEDLSKKYNLHINAEMLKQKINNALVFFEKDNKNIYFESIPEYSTLDSLKGTEIVKIPDPNISTIYLKKEISNNLKLLFNEKAKNIFDEYNTEACKVHDLYEKHLSSLKDQYKLINLSYRKNIFTILNNVLLNIYNTLKQSYNPTIYDKNLHFLMDVEKNLNLTLNQIETSLNTENSNHLNFQKMYTNIGVNQDSLNSYKKYVYHLNNFKKILTEITTNIVEFKSFLENNYYYLQLCEMNVSNFFKHMIDELNSNSNTCVESFDSDYTFYKNLLSEEKEKENEEETKEETKKMKNNTSSTTTAAEATTTAAATTYMNEQKVILPASPPPSLTNNIPKLTYSNFHKFLKKNNISVTASSSINNSSNIKYFEILKNYINIHSEEKLYFTINAIYFSMNIQLEQFSNDLAEIKGYMQNSFLNLITEEEDGERLNTLYEKQKEMLDLKKKKLEENVSAFESNLHKIYEYYHEYNKLDQFESFD